MFNSFSPILDVLIFACAVIAISICVFSFAYFAGGRDDHGPRL